MSASNKTITIRQAKKLWQETAKDNPAIIAILFSMGFMGLLVRM